MYEESEAERFRAKLKDDFEEFVHNQDVYTTLLNLNQSTYELIFEAAIHVFNCSPDDLKIDELKELEGYLKLAKKRYHALVAKEENETNIIISDEEEQDPEPVKQPEAPSPSEITWHMPREIPKVNNMSTSMVQPFQQPILNDISNGGNIPQQNIMVPSWNPWRSHAPYYGLPPMQNQPQFPPMQNQPQFPPMQNQPPYQPVNPPQFNPHPVNNLPHQAHNLPHPVHNLVHPVNNLPHQAHNLSHPVHNLVHPVNNLPHQAHNLPHPDHNLVHPANNLPHLNPVRIPGPTNPSSGYIYNQSIRPLNQNHQFLPSTSQQMASEKPTAMSYREHRLMKEAEERKQQEIQRRQQEEQRKKEEEQRKKESLLQQKKQEEDELKRERSKEKEINLKKFRQQQIEDYNKRESEVQAGTSSKKSDSERSRRSESSGRENKKSVSWDEESITSINNNNNCDSKLAKKICANNEKAVNKSPKAQSSSESEKSKLPKKSKSKTKKSPEVKKPASKSENSKGKDTESENKKTENDKKSADNKKVLQVYHPQSTVKLLKGTTIPKRKSNSPEKENNQSKRLRCDDKESCSSNCDTSQNTVNLKVKEEPMSDDENLDGKTDVSSDAPDEVQPEKVQETESANIYIKEEPEENFDTASTVENIDIKEEVMSTIDQDKSSEHTDKLVNDIAENFINICGDEKALNTIAESFIDFSRYETVTDSQDRCASWLNDISNTNFERTTESPLTDFQFYLSKDEEVEVDEIVPFFPARSLGAPEIVPKEEEN